MENVKKELEKKLQELQKDFDLYDDYTQGILQGLKIAIELLNK